LIEQPFLRLKPLAVFLAVFTICFYIFAVTLKYSFPFLAGLLLAMIVQPLIRMLSSRFHWKKGLASALATLLVFAILFGLLFLLGFWLVTEISNLLNYVTELSKNNFGDLSAPINAVLTQIGTYLNKVDMKFIQQNQNQLLEITKSGAGVITAVLSTTLKFLTSLPAIFTMLIVMIFSTYFFSKDLDSIKRHFIVLMPSKTATGLKNASKHGANISGRFVMSYLLVYFITFIETLIVFFVLGVPYPLVLSLVTGIADILPVFGPGTIYIPLAVIYLCTGKIFNAVALLVCWLLITAIRQVIEPKLVSSSINIHPLYMLAAIYFALVSANFWVLIYFSLLAILYQVLTHSGMLPKLFPENPDEEKQGPPAQDSSKQA